MRDFFRKGIEKADLELIDRNTRLALLREKQMNEGKATDEIVTQVFGLNVVAVRAARDREECLKRHIFPRLIGDDGKLCRQLAFTSTDQLRRVVAMVNTMTVIDVDLAIAAKTEVEKFFARFQEETPLEGSVAALYDLTRQMLVEKTSFKVGPELYRFLAMELDEAAFPELVTAQRLLRLSIRSEKTSSYIRLFQRTSHADPWEPVAQS